MPVSDLETVPRRTLKLYYPWVVIGIAFLTVAVAFGLRNSFAVFLIAVTEEFGWSRGLASGALMVGSIVWTAVAPVIGLLLDRYGPRPVLATGALIMALGFVISGMAQSVVVFYLGMGVLVGIGFAALPMTSQATFLSNWFVEKRGMAIGLAASGIGLGIWLLVPLTQKLIDGLGWRQTYFALAALLAFGIAPLNYFLQRRSPEEMNLTPDFGKSSSAVDRRNKPRSGDGLSLREALRTARFWLFALGVLCGAIPLHMVLIHQVAAVSDAGFSREASAFALGMIGFYTAPAMVLMGLMADRIGRELSYALGSASLMIGIALLMVIGKTESTWMLHAFPPFIAAGFSSRQSLYPTIAADLFHGKAFGAVIGAIALFIGAGAGIGPWLGGAIYDWTGGYHAAFWIAQGMSLLSVGFISLAGAWRYR